ncbi:MAG TPA: glycosyltransferase family 39 protein [Gemmatales bacterium]|nr:glycosyltransferase family 39 protein [Gemmatales bacterium]HMP16071.1 glycosyltransferase family 39 protein [Gemmatales bacterium]
MSTAIHDTKKEFCLGLHGSLIIIGFGAVILLAYHFSNRTLTMHEVLYAQPAREMLASGDWLIPRIAGEVFSDKPPFTMWLIACSMFLFQSENEWVVRLPSSFAYLLTGIIIAITAARWFGRRIGILTGLIQLSSFYSLQMGMLAEADMLLILSITATFCWFAWTQLNSPAGKLNSKWTPWIFHALVGITFMIKGPIGVLFILGGLGLFSCICFKTSYVRLFIHPGGLLLLIMMILPYPFLAGNYCPQILQDWLIHNWGRFRGEMSHLQSKQSIFFYLYHLPLVLLPAAPWFVIGLYRKSIRREPISLLILSWLVPGLIILSCSAWKWKHYMYPLLPGLSIITAYGLDYYLNNMHNTLHKYWRPMMLLMIIVTTICIVVIIELQPLGMMALLMLIPFLACICLILMEFTYRRCMRLVEPLLLATVLISLINIILWIMPFHDQYRQNLVFADSIHHHIAANQTLHIANLMYEQITYYVKRPLIGYNDVMKVIESQSNCSNPMWLLIKSSEFNELQKLTKYIQVACISLARNNKGYSDPLLLVTVHSVQPEGD